MKKFALRGKALVRTNPNIKRPAKTETTQIAEKQEQSTNNRPQQKKKPHDDDANQGGKNGAANALLEGCFKK